MNTSCSHCVTEPCRKRPARDAAQNARHVSSVKYALQVDGDLPPTPTTHSPVPRRTFSATMQNRTYRTTCYLCRAIPRRSACGSEHHRPSPMRTVNGPGSGGNLGQKWSRARDAVLAILRAVRTTRNTAPADHSNEDCGLRRILRVPRACWLRIPGAAEMSTAG